MNRRRQAIYLFLNPSVIVEVQIVNELLFEPLHRVELLQIQNSLLSRPKMFSDAALSKRFSLCFITLSNVLCFKHPLVPLVLVLPAISSEMATTVIRSMFDSTVEMPVLRPSAIALNKFAVVMLQIHVVTSFLISVPARVSILCMYLNCQKRLPSISA